MLPNSPKFIEGLDLYKIISDIKLISESNYEYTQQLYLSQREIHYSIRIKINVLHLVLYCLY